MIEINSQEALENAMAASGAAPVFLFKHSTRCPISAAAQQRVREYETFTAGNPAPVYLVNVIEARPVSNTIAQRLGVEHQSPQIILVRQGAAVWHVSHGAITAEAMRRALAAA